MTSLAASWLRRLRHDLVKRALWAARDLQDAGREPEAADCAALRAGLTELIDGEGQTLGAVALWLRFRTEAEAAGFAPPVALLDAFEGILDGAERAARAVTPATARATMAAVLTLEPALTRMEEACRASS